LQLPLPLLSQSYGINLNPLENGNAAMENGNAGNNPTTEGTITAVTRVGDVSNNNNVTNIPRVSAFRNLRNFFGSVGSTSSSSAARTSAESMPGACNAPVSMACFDFGLRNHVYAYVVRINAKVCLVTEPMHGLTLLIVFVLRIAPGLHAIGSNLFHMIGSTMVMVIATIMIFNS
jgi:hypothetical protein